MATTHIPLFKNSNDLLRAIGFPHKSHIANFDVYSIESLSASTKEYMPPYRQDFYQIGLLNYVGDSRLSLDSSDLDVDEYSLWFVVPGQVFSWVRDPNIKGINILFKKEFISGLVSDFREEFPFLNTTENKVLKLSKKEYKILLTDIERIKSIYSTEFPYQKNMLQGVLFSFLYFTKGIFERVKSKQTHFTRGQVITQKFEILLDNMYLQTKNVSDYAEALNITSNYLTTVIKRVTGKC